MAQWIRRLPTEQEIPGSTPGTVIFAVLNYILLRISVEPQCIQGRAYMDGNRKFIKCGGAGGTLQPCPANFFCYFDGNTYGCCPTQCRLI